MRSPLKLSLAILPAFFPFRLTEAQQSLEHEHPQSIPIVHRSLGPIALKEACNISLSVQ